MTNTNNNDMTKTNEKQAGEILMTDFRRRKIEKEAAIYKDYNDMMSKSGAMATQVDNILMEKYNIGSRTTLWAIRRRVEQRMREEAVI